MIVNNNYPNQDINEYDVWIRSIECWGLMKYMYYILDDLDCSVITYRNMRKIHTKDYLYSKLINRYNKCLTRIKDPIKYNFMAELLEKRHKDNLEFEENNPEIIEEIPKTKKQAKERKKTPKNIWVKDESKDLFENKPKYIYSNLKTGECIVSDNPNLLDELNAKPKKEKKQKVKIPKFNFKIEYK